MKRWYFSLFILLLFIIGCSEKTNSLSVEEKEKIKNEVIETYKQHTEDIKRLDYKALMSYYVNDPETALFVDGHYWGGYCLVLK
jgi:PBP1b-binding outer membrane lipoprotein LpoB